jgi:hypothetical protein
MITEVVALVVVRGSPAERPVRRTRAHWPRLTPRGVPVSRPGHCRAG